jgi:hypothetical protein
MGVYVPRLVESREKTDEWLSDLKSISEYDIPQAQLLRVGERGFPENLPAKTEERECGLAQLETARVIGEFLDNYGKIIPEIANLKQPICTKNGCKRGGCTFGTKLCLDRLI